MKILILAFVFVLSAVATLLAQDSPLSARLAETAMNRIWVDARNQPGIPRRWNYEQGVMLMAIAQCWSASGAPN
jgi:rhamnogalacturonyl hydrolase YesR